MTLSATLIILIAAAILEAGGYALVRSGSIYHRWRRDHHYRKFQLSRNCYRMVRIPSLICETLHIGKFRSIHLLSGK